ncbi:MAG: asparagine synthase (glutamine-hydrolyzing) [Coriobacteriia bacterium]|nr:asparagine synthase (glutamine-hydrolyzing) [Coriobacteriia bacterium]
MCGIAGLLSHDAGATSARLSAMLATLEHRGPDDYGVHRDGPVALGHRRLAIIDLTDGGHQPMILDGGRLAVVFNGEIFNYIELRDELRALGRRFESRSDTEVILHAYDVWGIDGFNRFNGMWSFAIWDRERRTLICSRDRFGVKPLYWALVDDEFLFASEVKALIAAKPELAEPNEPYLARFLRTSLTDDGEETFFRRVRQLLPAHTMVISLADGSPRVVSKTRYWALDVERVRETYDFEDTVGQFRALLEDSVRLRLRSDVPVGTCLSGGLDSSAIVALVSRQLRGAPVWTFSALYPFEAYDESRFVRIVNTGFPTVAHEVWPKPDDLLTVMPRIAWHQDMPSAGPGLYSQWHVMEAAHGEVTVLLDGQGADEVLGGYRPYFIDYIRSRARAVLASPSPAGLRRLAGEMRTAREMVGEDFARQLALSFTPEAVKRALRPLMPASERADGNPELLRLASDEDPWRVEGPFSDRLANRLYDATVRQSLPALLRYEDRNSMAFSLEARTPFLDFRLVEYSLVLPFDERIDGQWTKSILRRALAGILPDEVVWRRDKKGYPTPFAEWLRSEFRAQAEEVIFSPEFRRRAVFDPAVVESKWREHVEGLRDNSWNVWRWLAVELWYRIFIDRRAARPW